jgi:hypothetical protein
VESLEAQSQCFFRSVECPPHHNPGTVFRKAAHKRREAEEGVGVLGEVSCGVHVLLNFLRVKKNFKVAGGSGKFRTINSETMMLGRDWTYQMGRRLSLAIMDLRETPVHSVAQDHAKQAYFHFLMSTLLTLKQLAK